MNKQTIQSKNFVHLSKIQSKPSTVKKVTILFALLLFAFSAKGQLVMEKRVHQWHPAFSVNTNILSFNGPSFYDNHPPSWPHISNKNITTWHGDRHMWFNSYDGNGPYIVMNIQSSSMTAIGAGWVNPTMPYYVLNFGVYRNDSFLYNNVFAADYWANGGFYSISDLALKTNIAPVNGALNTILALKPVTYNWRDNSNRTPRVAPNPKEIGFIAQDIEKILPDIVAIHEDKRLVNYQAIIPLLTAAIQELTARIEVLESQIKAK